MKSFFILVLLQISISLSVFGQKTLADVEFEAENVRSVTIDGSFCDVILKTGDRVYCKGLILGGGDPDDYNIQSDIRGDDLFIQVEKRGRSWTRISKASITVTIPDQTRIKVDNSSGDVYLSDVGSNDIDIETSSGEVRVESSDGIMRLESTSGDIDVIKFSGELTLESTSGNQELRDITGSVETTSTSGDILVSRMQGRFEARATSGDISISRMAGGLLVRSTSGDIEGYNVKLSESSEFKASSGDIDMELLNDEEELSYDLVTSSGDLRAAGRSAEKELYIKNGSIQIRGVTSSGDQRYMD
ncbi:MAG: DUF4097 family beta strand repeat protein [Cyclobacteriaceae bacterium]|nr:DUF4097 family beta strand repeat protein [Cyclobacteriaceae bacterium HetDA_MAG_MS6]